MTTPFRTKKHLEQACKILIAPIARPELWGAAGPNPERITGTGSFLNRDETALWETSLALWNGNGNYLMVRCTALLDIQRENLREMAGEFLKVLSPADTVGMEAWMAKWGTLFDVPPLPVN